MKPNRWFVVTALLIALPAASLGAQALPSILSMYVAYNTRKVVAHPTGDLKASLDSVDGQLSSASQTGNTSEVRRLLARGGVLLAGKPWTDVADYNSSLLLRTDRLVVESQKPYAVRLEQLYAPAIALKHSLTAHATIAGRSATVAGSAPFAKDLGTFEGVSRDLRESPLKMELDLRDLADGRYNLNVEVTDSARALGTATLSVIVRKGIDAIASHLESEAVRAPEALRAEILFPVDRMKHVNQGVLELRTFDVDNDLAAAEKVVAAVKAKKDPFAGRTGDMKRHYVLEPAKEIMPYRVYLPSTYKSSQPAALIVALHGLGQTEDSFFDAYGKRLPALAEKFGYIVVAPLGYRVDGSYGWGVGTPPADAAARRTEQFADADVMQALAQARKLYNVDPQRIYLLGHSMGAIGTWKIAAKYPDVWAAIAAFSGQGAPTTLSLMKNIPEFVVHGDADATVNVRGSRAMVEAMKALNIEVEYIEVPGGSHTAVVEPNLPGAVQFFNAHRKGLVKQ